MSKICGFERPVLDPGKTLFERFPRGEHGQERARVGYGSLRSLHPTRALFGVVRIFTIQWSLNRIKFNVPGPEELPELGRRDGRGFR